MAKTLEYTAAAQAELIAKRARKTVDAECRGRPRHLKWRMYDSGGNAVLRPDAYQQRLDEVAAENRRLREAGVLPPKQRVRRLPRKMKTGKSRKLVTLATVNLPPVD